MCVCVCACVRVCVCMWPIYKDSNKALSRNPDTPLHYYKDGVFVSNIRHYVSL